MRLPRQRLTLRVSVAYVLDPIDAAWAARRKGVGIEQRENGSLCFWHSVQEFLATAFAKKHGVRQGEAVHDPSEGVRAARRNAAAERS
jgi:hypothetical protein